uniref:CBM21 domain-containing protein n=1 Tax=Strigops habroptila TaxID=2489341 RepID=A0A672TEV0_STRHB
MDKAGSLHTSVPTLPSRLYLQRNFSCSACLHGSLVEQRRAGCSPDGDAAPPPVVREAAGEKPPSAAAPSRCPRPALQQSPSRRKTVQFADSLGLELTSVRHFCEADLPQVPLPAPPPPCTADLFKTRKPPVLFGTPPLLEPLFPPQPRASPGFIEWVQQHKVRLEWVRAEPAGLRGAVRVLDLAYEKAVSVRYTLNSWASCAEVPAAYQAPGPADGITDRFAFLLPLGVAAAAKATLEFAVRYRIAGAEYWDNNEGKNYRLWGQQLGPTSPSRRPSLIPFKQSPAPVIGWVHVQSLAGSC